MEKNEMPALGEVYGKRRYSQGGGGFKNVDFTNWRRERRAASIKFCDDSKQVFLEHFARTNRLTEAAKVAGVSTSTVNAHYVDDPEFQQAYEDAKKTYRDSLHQFATDLMINGVEKPVIGGQHRDQVIATVTEYPIALIQMELRRVDPDYKDRQVIESSGGGGVVLIPAHMEAEDWIKEQMAKNTEKQEPTGE